MAPSAHLPLRPRIALPLLAAGLLAAALAGALVGPVRLAPAALLDVLAGRAAGSPEARILLDVRLPRVFLAGLVGAALALAGTAFQGLLRNPLADPFILGTSSGAALAAALLLAAGAGHSRAGPLLLPAASFAGSLLALVAVYLLARTGGRVAVETLLLSGVIVNAFLFALVLLVLALANREAMDVLLWLMGSLALVVSGRLVLSASVLIAGAALAVWAMARALDVMSLGEEPAALLGVATEPLKRRLFVAVSLLVGAAVSVSGIIGFVGLVVPHVARILVGAAHRTLLPAAALLGALALVAADAVARTALAPSELPVGVVTALCGAPFFLVLLRRAKRAA